MAEIEAENFAFYVSKDQRHIIEKLDKICKKEDRSRSYMVAKILEENIDKYLKR